MTNNVPDYQDNLVFPPQEPTQRDVVLNYAIITELHSKIQAKDQLIKELKEKFKTAKNLLNKIDTIYSIGINKSEENPDEYILYKSVVNELNRLFNKWEEIRNDQNQAQN